MREIKFKAWDKVDKKIYDVLGISFHHKSITVDIGGGKYLQDDVSRFELMQYTGLKDKNGVEIYEGYIITGPHDYGPGGFIEVKAPVGYHVDFGYQLHYFLLDETKVIGNIYEHPHLLRGDKS